jgi:hypothetical protein
MEKMMATLGRIEGKQDLLIKMKDDHEVRIRTMEKFTTKLAAWGAGIGVMFTAGLGLFKLGA